MSFPTPLCTGTWGPRVSLYSHLPRLEISSPHLTRPPGWRFPTAEDTDAAGENVVPDPVAGHEGYTHLRDIYFGVNPDYEGRFTVPVLFDKKTQTIVNNESSEILRMFGTEVTILGRFDAV